MTTKFLPDYLSPWEQKERTLPRNECKPHFKRQQYMIVHSMFFREHRVSGRRVLGNVHGKCSESYQASLPLPIEMSIVLLEETHDLASRKAYGIDLGLGSESMFLSPSLITNLNSTGWCPSEVSLITRRYDDILLVFASQVERRRWEQIRPRSLQVAQSNVLAQGLRPYYARTFDDILQMNLMLLLMDDSLPFGPNTWGLHAFTGIIVAPRCLAS